MEFGAYPINSNVIIIKDNKYGNLNKIGKVIDVNRGWHTIEFENDETLKYTSKQIQPIKTIIDSTRLKYFKEKENFKEDDFKEKENLKEDDFKKDDFKEKENLKKENLKEDSIISKLKRDIVALKDEINEMTAKYNILLLKDNQQWYNDIKKLEKKIDDMKNIEIDEKKFENIIKNEIKSELNKKNIELQRQKNIELQKQKNIELQKQKNIESQKQSLPKKEQSLTKKEQSLLKQSSPKKDQKQSLPKKELSPLKKNKTKPKHPTFIDDIYQEEEEEEYDDTKYDDNVYNNAYNKIFMRENAIDLGLEPNNPGHEIYLKRTLWNNMSIPEKNVYVNRLNKQQNNIKINENIDNAIKMLKSNKPEKIIKSPKEYKRKNSETGVYNMLKNFIVGKPNSNFKTYKELEKIKKERKNNTFDATKIKTDYTPVRKGKLVYFDKENLNTYNNMIKNWKKFGYNNKEDILYEIIDEKYYIPDSFLKKHFKYIYDIYNSNNLQKNKDLSLSVKLNDKYGIDDLGVELNKQNNKLKKLKDDIRNLYDIINNKPKQDIIDEKRYEIEEKTENKKEVEKKIKELNNEIKKFNEIKKDIVEYFRRKRTNEDEYKMYIKRLTEGENPTKVIDDMYNDEVKINQYILENFIYPRYYEKYSKLVDEDDDYKYVKILKYMKEDNVPDIVTDYVNSKITWTDKIKNFMLSENDKKIRTMFNKLNQVSNTRDISKIINQNKELKLNKKNLDSLLKPYIQEYIKNNEDMSSVIKSMLRDSVPRVIIEHFKSKDVYKIYVLKNLLEKIDTIDDKNDIEQMLQNVDELINSIEMNDDILNILYSVYNNKYENLFETNDIQVVKTIMENNKVPNIIINYAVKKRDNYEHMQAIENPYKDENEEYQDAGLAYGSKETKRSKTNIRSKAYQRRRSKTMQRRRSKTMQRRQSKTTTRRSKTTRKSKTTRRSKVKINKKQRLRSKTNINKNKD